jgi:hypothetical protein
MALVEKKRQKNIEAYRWFFAQYGERISRRVCANWRTVPINV